MTYQIKSTLVSLVSSIIIFSAYAAYILLSNDISSINEAGNYQFWAKAILYMLPVLIFSQILVIIIFTIVDSIITRRQDHDVRDELDKIIELKSTRNAMFYFLAVFFGGLLIPATGGDIMNMMMVYFFGMIGVGILGDLFKLYYYNRGI